MAYSPSFEVAAAAAKPADRLSFLRKTYGHLTGAVLAFVVLEAALLSSPLAEPIVRMTMGSRLGWALTLGAFMLVGFVADKWARSATSVPMQYLGLGLYVVAQAIITLPLLVLAASKAGPSVIPMAGMFTVLLFIGLSGTVFFTGHDFSWMGKALMIAGLAAFGVIIASLIFGFSLGLVFSAAMILLAAGYILFYTSNVLHHYPVGSHVAASLTLFSAVALLFWYVLRFLMDRR